MNEILFHYHPVHATSWVYLSSLLMIGLFFKFSRLWSVRNLDLIGLILLAPGLLLVQYGKEQGVAATEYVGYVWLFVTGGLFVIRLLLDPMMVRRPLLEPNLSVGGMTFVGVSLLVFLMANVVTRRPAPDDLAAVQLAEEMSARQAPAAGEDRLAKHGPGYPLLYQLPRVWSRQLFAEPAVAGAQSERERAQTQDLVRVATARSMAILSHLAIVIGMVLIGYRHFDNMKTGIAAALIYLMLPYTAIWTGRVDHVLPAALLVWAVYAYRRPLVSGMLMGLAIGVTYYPVFLVPLWISFYWQRGLLRFLSGVAITVIVLVASLALTSVDLASFLEQVRQMFGWTFPRTENLEGFWNSQFSDAVYRIPVLTAFIALCFTFAIWPAQKNLGTLMSCSAVVMLGTQFWHAAGDGGGLYMAWYLPLMLLTIFRPNLEDRVALTVLGEGWLPKRRLQLHRGEQAA